MNPERVATLVADLAAVRAELEQVTQELQGGHARLNECVGWEETKDLPLYQRISKKIEQLSNDKSEVEHTIKAIGHEMDELRARAEAAKHRQAAAEYRAQRIVWDAELKAATHAADQQLASLRGAVETLKEYARHKPDCASWKDWRWSKDFSGEPTVIPAQFDCTCGLARFLSVDGKQQ